MTCYLLFYAPVKKLVPRGSGRPIGGGGGGVGGLLTSLFISSNMEELTICMICSESNETYTISIKFTLILHTTSSKTKYNKR